MVGRTDISRCCCGGCVRIETVSEAVASVDANATFALSAGKWTLTRTSPGSITGDLLFTPTVSTGAPFYFLARVKIYHGTGRPNFRVAMLAGADNAGSNAMAYTRFVESTYYGAALGTLANFAETTDCGDLLDSSYPVGVTSTTLAMFLRSNGAELLAANTTTDANALSQVGTGLVDRSPAYGGNRFGFRLSNLSADVTAIEIDQISAGPLTSGSDVCQVWRTNCCDGAVPDSSTLEISGLPDESSFQIFLTTYSGPSIYQWRAKLDLSQFDGTHILENGPFVKDSEGEVWWSYCRTDEQCVWGIWLEATTNTLVRYPSFGFPAGQPATEYPVTVHVLLKVTLFRYLDGTVHHWVQVFIYDSNGVERAQRYYYVDGFTGQDVLDNIGGQAIATYDRISSELSTTDESPCEEGIAEADTDWQMQRSPGELDHAPIWPDLAGSWSI